MEIYCCGCGKEVDARLTTGKEIYPNRQKRDLYNLPFWKCDDCGNSVGCHHKTIKRTKPLGCIPTPELKNARYHIHKLLDPIWESGRCGRKELYSLISEHIGHRYHTAEIRTIEEARNIYRFVRQLNF